MTDEVYRLKDSISAILDKIGRGQASVIIPPGAILRVTSMPSSTLFGMVGVLWEGRHYSVYPSDLVRHAERVSTA